MEAVFDYKKDVVVISTFSNLIYLNFPFIIQEGKSRISLISHLPNKKIKVDLGFFFPPKNQTLLITILVVSAFFCSHWTRP